MPGLEFEQISAQLLRENNFNSVYVTQGSGDFGADITAHKDGHSYVIQCKKYSNKVGLKAVQEVYASKIHYKADKAVVLTNSFFTPAAEKLAEETEVELWDRTALLELANHTGRFAYHKDTAVEEPPKDINGCLFYSLVIGTLAFLIIGGIAAKLSEKTGETENDEINTTPIQTPISTILEGNDSVLPTPYYLIGKVKKGVNIRSEPSKDSKRLGYAGDGDELLIIKAFYTERWHQILYENTICYVSANYIDIENPATYQKKEELKQ